MQPLQGIDQRDVFGDHAAFTDPELEDIAEQDQHIRSATLFVEKVKQHPVIAVTGFA